VNVKAGTKTIDFSVMVDPTTPLGEHHGLVVELAMMVKSTQVIERVGRGSTLVIFPLGGITVDETGRPLSRLEMLRKLQADRKNTPRP